MRSPSDLQRGAPTTTNRYAANPLATRADVERLLLDLVDPLIPHFSPGSAQVRLGENRGHFGDPAGWLEGFARPLWGLAPLAASGARSPPIRSWQRGLANGSDPTHAEYWGEPGDFDQRSVEQAAFGFALSIAPEVFWEPLSAKAKADLSTWLEHINHVLLVPNNWLFFRVLVNLGLWRVGCAGSRENVLADLSALDGFHLGGGWYSDGASSPPHRDGRLGDYYVPMAFHLYGLIYARLAAADDPAGAARFIERARAFAGDFVHWFAADGSAVPFGRSLTYRFAQGAFWGALAFADVEALPWGVVKGLYLRHLRWWMQQPMFSESGLLTIGYAYPNLLMAESYNSPGSPYWALKAFLPLALPAEHPFWAAEEAPLPARRRVHTVPGANLVLMSSPGSREVTALNPGQPVWDWPRHASHKYSKYAYSTRFGFSVAASSASLGDGGLDNVLSLSDDGRNFRGREHCLDAEVAEGVTYSRWQPWPDVEVETWLLAADEGHIRVHRLRCGRKLWAADGGFAPGFHAWRTVRSNPAGPLGPETRTPLGASLLRNLHGERRAECISLGPNSSLITSLAIMPALLSEHEPGTYWLACAAIGDCESEAEFTSAAAFSFAVTASGCEVLRDGVAWWQTDETARCGHSAPERLEAMNRET